jgi:putative ABC transport system permease protein
LTGRNRPVDANASITFAAQLVDRLQADPGVERVAIASAVPLDIHGSPMRYFSIEGKARADGELDQAVANTVTPGYFQTLDIPILQGGTFVDLLEPSTAPQVIVNEAFVRRYLSDVPALGRRFESSGRTYTICGVVRTSLYNAFGEAPTPALYFSYRDRPSPQGEVHVRARTGDGSPLATPIRAAVRALDPTVPLFNVRTLTDHVERNLVFRRIPARMFVVLGPLLLVLASTGIYAVVAYGVSQRRKEMAIRLALGATSGRVVRDVVAETLRVVAIGAAAGWVIALLIDREVSDGTGVNIGLFAGVPFVLIAVAALACWWPAVRAGRIDPYLALKQE